MLFPIATIDPNSNACSSHLAAATAVRSPSAQPFRTHAQPPKREAPPRVFPFSPHHPAGIPSEHKIDRSRLPLDTSSHIDLDRTIPKDIHQGDPETDDISTVPASSSRAETAVGQGDAVLLDCMDGYQNRLYDWMERLRIMEATTDGLVDVDGREGSHLDADEWESVSDWSMQTFK